MSVNDLTKKLEEMINRYQSEIKERDAKIEALTEDIAALSKVAISKGYLRELPVEEGYRWIV